MFKRRKPRSYAQIAQETVYPRGGWRRAGRYTLYRLRRLPDPPHRIGRGVAAGVFVSFTPLFGAHFFVAGLLAWAIGGNVLAALIGTLVGNPLTFPFIAVLSVDLGRRILDMDGNIGPQVILSEVGRAIGQVATNFLTLASDRAPQWGHLGKVFEEIIWPYIIGGLLPGFAAALIAHALTVSIVQTYQRRRALRLTRKRQPPTDPPQ